MSEKQKANRTAIEKFRDSSRAGHDELFHLILDPDLEFITLLLNHSGLDEAHLTALLKRRDLTEELINLIHKRYKQSALSHRLILALVKNPATSGTLVRNLLPHLRLFELVDLCKLPGASPDQKLAAERAVIQRLPTTPLGNKITLARRGTATIVSELVKEGHAQVFEACLNNPHLKEASLFQFLRGAAASAETISQIARHSRWKERPNLKTAILKNRKTPDIWLTLWLPRLNLPSLNQLLNQHKANPAKKRLIEAEIKERTG